MRDVGIVAPFGTLGVGIREKFVLSSPKREMGTGDLCRGPLAAVRYRRSRQTSGSRPFGDCRRVLRVPGPRGQYLGKKFVLSRNLGYKTRGYSCG